MLSAVHTYADDTQLNVGGYSRNFFIYSDQPDGETQEFIVLFRLKFDKTLTTAARFELAYELAPWYRDIDGDATPVGAARPAALKYRIDDLNEALYPDNPEPDEEFVLLQNLDRAALYYSLKNADITLGRQAIAFGSARAVNPTDVLAPYTYATLAKEERVGVDTLRVRVPTGELGEYDLGVVAGEDAKPENSAAFVRRRLYVARTDITLTAIAFRESELLGVDLTRSIGGAGTWLEAADAGENIGSSNDYFRLSVGTDYSFTEDLYAWLEYHYNGAGSRNNEDYFGLLDDTAYTRGGVYLLGKNYIAPGFTYQLTPLIIIGFQGLWNLDDGSALVAPSIEYSLADDVTARFGGYAGIGKGSDNPLVPTDEFGNYPDVWYASANFYF
jgi:hypothetical protein